MKFNFWKKKARLKEFELNRLREITSFLESMEKRMLEDLTTIINGDYGLHKKHVKEEIHFFDFEIFVDGFGIHFYPMDSENTQLGHKQLLPEYPNGFINDKDLKVYAEDFDDDWDRIDAYEEQLEKKVFDWFNVCWKKAGGLKVKGNHTLKIHDTEKWFDLRRQKWIDNN
jgi:hypothetical protein